MFPRRNTSLSNFPRPPQRRSVFRNSKETTKASSFHLIPAETQEQLIVRKISPASGSPIAVLGRLALLEGPMINAPVFVRTGHAGAVKFEEPTSSQWAQTAKEVARESGASGKSGNVLAKARHVQRRCLGQ